MKHIALRSKSVRAGDRPYTCPGLGDRIHSVYLAYQYGKAHNTPVTLHLTDDKWSIAGGKPSDKKKKSWAEIIDLFPKGSVAVQPWPVENLPEEKWLGYLKEQGVDAEIYYYKDTIKMHPNETVVPLEMSQYLKKPILLDEPDADVSLPSGKFITVQWDTTDPGRQISPLLINGIENKWMSWGFKIVDLGNNPGRPLAEVGKLMYNASAHLGVDSGFLHMAMLYQEFADIHLYSKGSGAFISHHVLRARSNGCSYTLV